MGTPADDIHRSDGQARLRESLHALTTALDDPDIDLDAHLTSLLIDLSQAIPSLLTVTVSVTVDDYDFTLTSPPRAQTSMLASSSLLLPLSTAASDDATAAQLILRASSPGAFVDFAADSTHLLGIDLTAVEFDRHLEATVPNADQDGGVSSDSPWHQDVSMPVADRSVIDYAIGILCDRNIYHTVSTARAALYEQAERDRTPLVIAAQRIVADAITPAPDQ